jgi:hypothetical protein
MPRALHVAALFRVETRRLPAAAALVALGILYGDIGTSPLMRSNKRPPPAGRSRPKPSCVQGLRSAPSLTSTSCAARNASSPAGIPQ